MTENGLEPLVDPFNETFSVKDTLTDCAAEWVAGVWRQVDSSDLQIPVVLCSDEEYGTNLPIQLR